MKKKAISLIILFVFCCSFISAISIREADIALHSTLDGTISAVSAALSDPPLSLQGVQFEYGEAILPSKISFVRSDLSSYLESLKFSPFREKRWYESFLSQGDIPLDPVRTLAIGYLEASGYEKGEVILDGTVEIDLSDITIDDATSWPNGKVLLSISLLVGSSELGESLIVEGEIEIRSGEVGKITVYSENLRINGELMSIDAFEISY